ncbi:MAG TPA: hypothetical protein VMB83_12870, partial [Roseiarcus sp.]|nr:hypothetical protein [Roseiarcus sp.]
MTSDASDLFLPHVRQFTIGLVLTDPPHPKVLGPVFSWRENGSESEAERLVFRIRERFPNQQMSDSWVVGLQEGLTDA